MAGSKQMARTVMDVPTPARGQAARSAPCVAGSASASSAASAAACPRCKDRSPLCFRCNGQVWQSCSRCKGTGEIEGTQPCWCSSAKGKGGGAGRDDCRRCSGSGVVRRSRPCRHCSGEGLWKCQHCAGRGYFPCGLCGRGCFAAGGGPNRGSGPKDLHLEPEPERGVTVTRCKGAELTQMAKLWAERQSRGSCQITDVWSVDNPLLAWRYRQRRAELRRLLGRAPDELQGYHGTAPRNVLSIAEQGFDAGRRAGQACGAGEYFAKDPMVSIGYCGGGSYMLVCQLCLGFQSTTQENSDGDHIWVPGFCYVISGPAQVLPLYVVRFDAGGAPRAFAGDGADALAASLSREKYFAGAARDERLIDLSFVGSEVQVEALPAAWWSGDLSAFKGQVVYDPGDKFGLDVAQRELRGRVLLAQRGGGKFAAKALRAEEAGASALLVVQEDKAQQLTKMTGDVECGLPAAMVSAKDGARLAELALSAGGLGLASAASRGAVEELPPNRPCAMTAESTDALWLGYLHGHFSDAQLASDVSRFLERHCPCMPAPTVRVVRGKFTQAKVALQRALSRDEVRALNDKAFSECGTERTVTVDDAHGSPGQRCPRSIARYCRGQSLRFIDPCWCSHDPLPTASASFSLEAIALESAKGDEIVSAFMESAPFHDGCPRVTGIRAVRNPQLERQHDFYRRYLAQKNGEAPRQVELYHGTNINILDTVYTHGLSPPSDMEASEACPVSGGKGLRTSLCGNGCAFCTEPHAWDRCHMYGLGVYLADLARKSHRYVSAAAPAAGGGRECKIVVCSVLLGDALQVEGHLRCGDAMHDVHSLRAMGDGDLPKLMDLQRGVDGKRPVDQKDILFIKGLGCRCRPGFSVFNSEYISFHPYQSMPRYEITYVV